MASSCLPSLTWIFALFFFFFFFFFVDRINVVEASRRIFKNPDSAENGSITSTKYRTAYHFQPPQHWINDPNGPMYYNGIYHLFYQYNPYAAVWGNISWAHSVSTDLIRWTGLGLAIAPTEPYEANGCWSGSATILPGNKPVILYTSSNAQKEQVQNIAYPKNLSDPFLREWTKPDYNPIIKATGDLNASEFRDPTTGWLGKDDGLWRMLVGNKIGMGGRAILYKSKDFVHWVRAKDPLSYSSGSGMWECPDFFFLPFEGGNKYVLKMSLDDVRTDHYMLGSYDMGKDLFVPDTEFVDYQKWPRYDYGNFYASKTFFDGGKNRRILWGWSNESDSVSDDIAKGWSGIQTIPRVVWLDKSRKQLVQWPVEELESLRRKQVQLHDVELETGGLVEIKGLNVLQADVEVEFVVLGLEKAEPFDPAWLMDPQKLCGEKGGADVHGGVGPFGLLVLASEDMKEHTAVFFRVYKADSRYMVLMCSAQRRSSLRAELYKPAYGGFVDIDMEKDGKISLRTLIDHSVVESFGGGGRTCITARVYPSLILKGNTHLYAFNNGSSHAKISSLKAWTMAKASIS